MSSWAVSWNRGAQRRAGSIRIECLAGRPEASFVVLETGLEIRHEKIVQLIARLEEVRQMATPLKVGGALQAGWGPGLHLTGVG